MSVALPAPGRMEGRTVIVTGASSGIGRAAARELAALGANLAVVGRNPERTRAVAAETGGTPYLVDYADLDSVRGLAGRLLEDLPAIHVLANNAGGLYPREDTIDGFDATFQQNHLAGFLLTNLLLPRLQQTAVEADPGSVRIVQTSSAANLGQRIDLRDLDTRRRSWLGGWRAYGRSKLMNILMTRQLARRLHGSPIRAYAFHPGLVATGFNSSSTMQQWGAALVAIPPEEGAAPLVRLAAAPTVPAPSGNYFSRLKAPGRTARQADDPAVAEVLWAASEIRAGLR